MRVGRLLINFSKIGTKSKSFSKNKTYKINTLIGFVESDINIVFVFLWFKFAYLK
jgi:hypothetical protein